MAEDSILKTFIISVGTPCPGCGTVLNAAVGDGLPTAGSITLCLYCFVFIMFTTEAPGLKLVTNAEWATLPLAERMQLTRLRDAAKKVTVGDAS